MYIGNSYYLQHHNADEWDSDFAQMQVNGHNTVRTDELITAWDLVEVEKGKIDFSYFDKVFELGEKYDIKILLGTGACSPPQWLLKENPDVQILDRDNNPYPVGVMWSWACINHPAYIEESNRYLNELIERYANHPQLLAWQIHNEPGFPFVPRVDRNDNEWYDYNPYTINEFRKWLQQKYQEIEKLNRAWMWIPTTIQYSNFNDVEAPRRNANEWGIPNAWLDWRRFTYDNWNQFIHNQHKLIKEKSDKLTMVNLYGQAVDSNGKLGVDSWTLPQQCDVIGYDLYPGMHPDKSNYASWFLDFAFSTAIHNKKSLWMPEMESGPIGGWAKGPNYVTTGADIRQWGLMALARGAKMLLYQGYRQWSKLPLNWGALIDWDRKPTERLIATKQLAEFIHEQQDDLTNAKVQRAKVAVFYSQENEVYLAQTNPEFNKSSKDMYFQLRQLGFIVEFIDPNTFANANDYELIIFPNAVLLSNDTAKEITNYVANGGKIITFPRTSMVNEDCEVWLHRPGGLNEVLGVKEIQIYPIDKSKINLTTIDDHTYTNYLTAQRQDIECSFTVKVIGTYEDGKPAITLNNYQQGVAIHCTASLNLAPKSSECMLSQLQFLLNWLEIKPEVNTVGDSYLRYEIRFLEINAKEKFMFISNINGDNTEHTISFNNTIFNHIKLLWSVGEVRINSSDNRSIDIKLPKGESLVAKVN